jgi:hypothetical protein
MNERKTLFVIAHHLSAPAIRLPKNPTVSYLRTLRLDSAEVISELHVKRQFLVLRPPEQLAFPSAAFSDSLTYFNASALTRDHNYVGVFQYRRILGAAYNSNLPVLHRYRIQSATLLKALERVAHTDQEKHIYVANPLRVISLEEQYSHSQAATLPLLKQLRFMFFMHLKEKGLDTSKIKSEVFYWSSLYLGPSENLLEFQDLLLRTFEKFDSSTVPSNLNPYESRWVGFIVERLFSDYIQCLIAANPGMVRTLPALQLNQLPLVSRLKKLVNLY